MAAPLRQTSYDPNGGVPRDQCYSNLTIQCRNVCMRSQGLRARDDGCQNLFVRDMVNRCGVERTSSEQQPMSDPQWDAYRQASMRAFNALFRQCQSRDVAHTPNGDEASVPLFVAMFTKTLPHDASGRVSPGSAYDTLRAAIRDRDVSLLGAVLSPGETKLVQPLGAFLLNSVGAPPSAMSIPAAPRFSSAEAAAEMVEAYCHALARDVAFTEYATDAKVIPACVGYLNAASAYAGPSPVTAANIFRGMGAGDLDGPYASQFLWMDAPQWPITIPGSVQFPTRDPANNRMVSDAAFLAVQNGTVTESGPVLSGSATFLSTGRDLAHVVWQDAPGKIYELAVLKALGAGAAFAPSSPYAAGGAPSANQHPFVTWNLADATACLYTATQTALSAAWYSKWAVHRRVRPEAYGNEVEQVRLGGPNVAGIHADLLSSGVLADIGLLNDSHGTPANNHYLPQAYPEGSPAHPSYPAGHATVSGACITVAKAFLDESFAFPAPVMPGDAAGSSLQAYVGPPLTVGRELNKLASNVSLGRDWAGVHYRSDGHEGILLGERIGISVLQDWVNRYPELGPGQIGFRLTSYLGHEISISPQHTHASNLPNPGEIGPASEFAAPDCCSL